MNALLAELKRRKVLRVAGVYILTSWLILQVAEILIPALQLDDWVLSLVLLMLVLGLPVALICSWALDLTPDGIRLESDQTHLVRSPALGAMALSLVVLAGMAGYHLRVDAVPEWDSGPDIDQPVGPAVAVVPFDAVGTLVSFSDGLTEEMLIELGHRSGATVVARSSTAAFGEQPADPRRLGEALNATHLIEGRVRQFGGLVRVTAHIIDTRTGYQLWSRRIDMPTDRIEAGQLETARLIAEQLATVIARAGRGQG